MQLIHAMERHARDKRDLVFVLLVCYVETLYPKGWRAMSARGGAGSWMIHHLKSGKQFHFRNGGNGCIRVIDRYQLGTTRAVLRSRADVLRWVRSL